MDVVFTAYFLVHNSIVGHTLRWSNESCKAVGTSSSEKAFWRHFEKCHHFDFMTVHDGMTMAWWHGSDGEWPRAVVLFCCYS
jgi:hypothetical protein